MKGPQAVCILLFFSSTPLEAAEEAEKRSDDPSPLQITVDNLAQQVAANKAEITSLKADLAKARTHIAFHAEFSHDPVTFGPSAPLLLDRVVTNIGNGYDAHTGNFLAPVSGSYLFAVHFMGNLNTNTYLFLMVDNTLQDQTYSDGDGQHWDHVSATTVIHLRAGQRVWLRSDSRGTKQYRGGHYTTFSGFLIVADP
ncbi:hypothetical protein BaRGS_00019615 [Batillaria attramentaria]|uniref:C1q domain-containing protein n=1 Tax=Batillaria attramentaria TaxID=370345 RepID=A0ABD0KPF4_9CAEN